MERVDRVEGMMRAVRIGGVERDEYNPLCQDCGRIIGNSFKMNK